MASRCKYDEEYKNCIYGERCLYSTQKVCWADEEEYQLTEPQNRPYSESDHEADRLWMEQNFDAFWGEGE